MPEVTKTDVKIEAKPVDPKDYWGHIGTKRRACFVPHPGVCVNGNLWLGRKELTFDEFNEALAMLSARSRHELEQRFGAKSANQIIQASGGGMTAELY